VDGAAAAAAARPWPKAAANGGVHELLECPVCTNSMFPPIHQVAPALASPYSSFPSLIDPFAPAACSAWMDRLSSSISNGEFPFACSSSVMRGDLTLRGGNFDGHHPPFLQHKIRRINSSISMLATSQPKTNGDEEDSSTF
jgi:hypothetical protein